MFKKAISLTLLFVMCIMIGASDSSMLLFKMKEFSTDFEAPDFSGMGLSKESAKSEFDYYIVQFSSVVMPSHRREIEKLGGKVFDYIPNNAYIVKMPTAQFNSMSSLKSVKFVQLYQPAYRVSPDLINNEQVSHEKEKSGYIRMLVSAFFGEDPIAFKEKLSQIPNVTLIEGFMPIRIEIPQDKAKEVATAIANITETYWVEREYPVELHNAWSRWIMDTFDTLYYKNGTLDSWKSALTISSANDSTRLQMYAHGIYGQNMIVGDDDTGCDWDNIYFRDPLGTKPVYDKDKDRDCETTGTHRKIVAYNVLADTFDLASSGHGSHTTGSVAADSMGSGLPSVTAFARVMGMAPLARLAFTDIGNASDALVLPTNYNDIYDWAYDAGARIHTSSWGYSSGGTSAYTTNCQQLDSCAWRNKDYMMFRSAGNSNLDRDSVNTPATAKNIVCVGATESGFGSATTTWATVGGATRNELNDVAEFSSHGPTKEGMMRPDVCGSGGWYIWSVDSDGDLGSGNAGIYYMGGTSMSTPTTAGFGALVRQYFTEGWYPSGAKNAGDAINPSGALIKAMIINSTRNSNGAYSISTINSNLTQSAPSQGQGWGRVTMADAIFFSGDVRDLKVWDVTSGFTSAGQYTEYTITTGPSTTEYTKIVLTWVDYPANTGVTSLVVNDLNLTVTVNGNTYLGNVFGTTARSITGGSADTENVTEVVWLNATPGQTITIRVTAAAVPYGPQPYALVASGDFITAAKINYKKSVILDSPTPVLVDAKLNNGETSDMNIWITNNTGASQTISAAKLREGSAYISNLDSLGSYEPVPDNDSAYSVYRFSVASNTPDGTSIPCTLFVSYGTKVDTSAFALIVSGVKVATLSTSSLTFDFSTKQTSSSIMSSLSVNSNMDTKIKGTYFAELQNKELSEFSSPKAVWDTLMWDDAINEGVVGWTGFTYSANKFTVAAPCTVRAIQWGRMINNFSRTDTLYVWSDNAGVPGTVLGKWVASGLNSSGIATIYRSTITSGPSVNGAFWVGVYTVLSTQTNRPSYMLSDTIGGSNSIYSSSSSGPWTTNSPDGDWVIRVEVEPSVLPADSGIFYVKNTDVQSVASFDVTGITKAKGSSWIASISPTTGTIADGDSLAVKLIIDTTGLSPYTTYYDTLLIATTADLTKAVTVRLPVTLIMGSMTSIMSVNLAYSVENSNVNLEWNSTEEGAWIIYRDNQMIGEKSGVGMLKFTDRDVSSGIHSYRISLNVNGREILSSDIVKVNIKKYIASISRPTPDPFSTYTIVEFLNDILQNVDVSVYDATGREVKNIFSGNLEKGSYNYKWDGTDDNQTRVTTGVYFIKIRTSTSEFTERLMFIK